jgi:hypothetical protein
MGSTDEGSFVRLSAFVPEDGGALVGTGRYADKGVCHKGASEPNGRVLYLLFWQGRLEGK